MSSSKNLQQNALSKVDSIIMGVAGTAPAYTLSASTATLVAAVGLMGTASILYAAILMFGIAFAFMFLNRWRSDSGASYAWVGRAINPSLGFMSGWALIVATTLFMISGSVPAATVTLDLVAPHMASNVWLVTIVGFVYFMLINILVMVGITFTAKFQKVMTVIEVGLLLIIAVGALVKFGLHTVHPFSWSWFSPGKFTFNTFMSGSLVAVYYYWGWDVTSNLTEETQDRNKAPGFGGVYGMVGIFILFEILQVAFQMGLTPGQVSNASTNLLPVIGNMIFPRPWGDIAILAVLLSTVATLETSLLQASRTLFSMGRDKVLGPKFAELHPRFQTPWLASVVIGILAIVLFVISGFSNGVNSIMTDAINAIGIQIAFYYGLTGFACFWYYRKTFRHSAKALIMKGIWPLVAGLFLWFIAIYDIPQLGWTTDIIGLGTLVVGVIPLFIYRFKYKSDFYKQPRESYSNHQIELPLESVSTMNPS